jgi:beta-mannosidase
LALWCGNNEIDEGWNNWGWKQQFGADTAKVWDNYTRLFHRLLPGLIQQYDPDRDYHSSSPTFGWGKKESMRSGDSHYWGVWWGMEAFAMYKQKVPRFMSEYGFQGFPPLSTLLRFIPEMKDCDLDSNVMNAHQKHPRGYETIQAYMEREYKVPDNMEDYAYISQLLQAYGMKTAIEAHRRAKPYCMGTLYWQFNDCWPVVSWSGIDYYKERKALQYFVKKSFAQHLLSFDTVEDRTCLWAVTDSTADAHGRLQIVFSTFTGEEIYRKDSLITIPANSSQKVWECRTADFIKGKDSLTTFCYAEFLIDDRQAAEAVHYFALPKNATYPAANVTVSLKNDGEFLLQADQLVKNIYILCDGKQSPFSDNFFDILPGKVYTVKLLQDTSIRPNLIQLKALHSSLNLQFVIYNP